MWRHFFLAFRQFSSRRGLPATSTSDNAKTFKSISREVSTIARSPKVFRYLSKHQTTWRFIVVKAGGRFLGTYD